MSQLPTLTFAVAVNDLVLLRNNFLRSDCLKVPHRHELLVQRNADSAAKAYNDAIDRSRNDLMVFCHQDVILPKSWLNDLSRALVYLDHTDPSWGVLGVYGKSSDRRGWGYVFSSGRGVIGEPFPHPVEIQTLDEIVLILRKSTGLRFDDNLPHFHLYGADICLRAARMQRRSYVMSAFCIHNTSQTLVLPREFYQSHAYFRRTWKRQLPVSTTCLTITRMGLPLIARRLQEFRLKHFLGKEIGGKRLADAEDVIKLCNDLENQYCS